MLLTGLKTTTAYPAPSVIKMKTVLFVCTGNTCRSPIAHAIFNQKAKQENLDAVAFSRGLFVQSDSQISKNALTSLNDIGINIIHTSKALTHDDIDKADLVFGITKSHEQALCDLFPLSCNKIFSFPTDISDPYGCDLEEYKMCRDKISDGIDKIFDYLKNEYEKQ